MINVFWWSKVRLRNEELDNFGDALVPYLLERTTRKKFRWIHPGENNFLGIFKKKHYLIIGSILHFATENSIVWGAGVISRTFPVAKAKFLAVRGPLTRQLLLKKGIKVPYNYGDPACLLAITEETVRGKKYKVGLIPHFVDYAKALEWFGNNPEINVINVLTNSPGSVLEEIKKCERVISSSLHGIIVSHAFGIPALWMKISDNLVGDDIKFYDYYYSMGIFDPVILTGRKISIKEVRKIFEENSEITLPSKSNFDYVIEDLLKSYPFKKSPEFKKQIIEYRNKIKSVQEI